MAVRDRPKHSTSISFSGTEDGRTGRASIALCEDEDMMLVPGILLSKKRLYGTELLEEPDLESINRKETARIPWIFRGCFRPSTTSVG